MKRLLLLLLVLSIAFSCASCNVGRQEQTESFVNPTYFVTLNCPENPELDGTVIEVTWGEAYSLPVPQKENYVFNGWTDGEKQIQTSGTWIYSTGADLTPKWSLRDYTIYCKMYPHFSDMTITYNVKSNDFSIPQPKHVDGFVFVGYTDAMGAEPTKVIKFPAGSSGDKSYVANWEKTSEFSLFEIEEGEGEANLDNYFIFEIVQDHAVLVGYYGETGAENLIIPSEYKGYPVTTIGEEAFYGMGIFTSLLSLPNTITTIENHAIGECKGLPMNVIDENLQRLEGDALNAWIEQVNIGEDNGGLNNLK